MSDPVVSSADSELRAHVERILSAHYELDCEIGRGGMGIVYRAKDRRLKRTVAIKVLPPELAFRSEIKTRFLREAETAAQLSHPNIVPIYTVDESEGLVFFVMAYVDGENLAKRIYEGGVLSFEETRRILREVADALAYAHERGVVHRDIKPDNIIISAQTGRPMVTDFGIARAVSDGDSRLTATGMAIGTPAYMSPEQAAGERTVDGRSDLYSLGIVAYQMLVGEPPFVAGSTPAMLVKHISERPTPIEQRRGDVPPELAAAIMQLLEKDPANRIQSAAALVEALDTGRLPAMPPRRDTAAARGAAPTAAPPPVAGRESGRAGIAPAYGAEDAGGEYGLDALGFEPTPQEVARWEAPAVQAFRRKLAPYLFVNAVIVAASIFSDKDFFFFTVLWSIFMAFRYAKLWADGYDWRDVFRQPRDRELIDVFDDAIGYVRALFNGKERQRLRAQRQARKIAGRTAEAGGRARLAAPMGARPSTPDSVNAAAARSSGRFGSRVRQAAQDRDEILRSIDAMPNGERARLQEVVRSAGALYDRIQGLALSISALDRAGAPGALDEADAEIARLEGEANPLEAASDDRVRRLAFLRRRRRALVDAETRRSDAEEKLETCAIALQNMRLDLARLRTGGAQAHQNITTLAMNAMSLADSVDTALYVADEMGRLGRRDSAATSTGS